MEVINSKKARDTVAILPEQRHQQKAVRINAFRGSLSILSNMVTEREEFFKKLVFPLQNGY